MVHRIRSWKTGPEATKRTIGDLQIPDQNNDGLLVSKVLFPPRLDHQ